MSKIDYAVRQNYLPEEIIGKVPFHAKVLAELSGLSVCQVYYRLRQRGCCLRDVRNGLAGIGKKIKDEYIVKNAQIESQQTKVHRRKKVG